MKSRRVLTIATFFLVIYLACVKGNSPPPDLYNCIDWECEEWISKGKTLLIYSGKTNKHLSFKKNEDIFILSKPVDKTLPDWLGKVGDKVGLVPKDMVREDKMNKSPSKFKHLLHEIPVLSRHEEEIEEDDEAPIADSAEEGIEIEDIDESSSDKPQETIPDLKSEGSETNYVESVQATASSTFVDFYSTQAASSVQDAQGESIASEAMNQEFDALPKLKLDDISSNPLEDTINLQPSTDTVLEGTTTLDYLPETPKSSNMESATESDLNVEEISSVNSTPQSPEEQSIIDETPEQVLDVTTENPDAHHPHRSVQATASSTFADDSAQAASSVQTIASSTFVDDSTQVTSSVQATASSTFVDDSTQVTSSVQDAQGESFAPEAMDDEFDASSKLEDITPDTVVDSINLEPSTDTILEGSSIADYLPETPKSSDMESATGSDPIVEETSSVNSTPQPPEQQSIVDETSEHVLDVTTENPDPETSKYLDIVEAVSAGDRSDDEVVSSENQASESAIVSDEDKTPAEPPTISSEPEPTIPSDDSLSMVPAEAEETATASVDDSNVDHHAEDHQETSSSLSVQDAESESIGSETVNDEFDDSSKLDDVSSDLESTTESDPNIEESSSVTSEPQTPEEQNIADETPPEQVLDFTTENPETSKYLDIVEAVTAGYRSDDAVVPSENEPNESVIPSDEIVAEPPTLSSEPEPTIPQDDSLSKMPAEENTSVDNSNVDNHEDHGHDHGHDHHHHHHHHHRRISDNKDYNDTESSSIILVIKHISSTLLSFLPEPLQDTILDVDDALVFTGIIALTLVSICVPYFFIDGLLSVRPLKKKVVELNKSLWKVSAAYETQQEEFEIFKQKAMAHDEFKKRADQSENDVIILKKLETKHREQITVLKTQLKSQMKEAIGIRSLIEKTLADKKVVAEECEQYKTAYESARESLTKSKDELANIHGHAKSSALQLGVSSKNMDILTTKISMLEQETEEIKAQLVAENEKREVVEIEKQEVEQSKATVEKELVEFKSICHQYEGTVSDLNDEISKLESELTTLKETLGEDSPLVEMAEVQARTAYAEKEVTSLRTRLEGVTAENVILTGKLSEVSSAMEEACNEKEQTNNRLQVLETYFKEREEEYIKSIEQLQLKESVRDKGKEELIKIIEEKEHVCRDLNDRLETLKDEFEETKQQHRNEIRALEAKGHENWLSLCQAERKAQDARKEAELLRQRLTAMSKEKDDEDGDGLNGEVPMFPVLPHDLVPLPILDEPPSYFGLGDFVPPPPLPEGEEREPHRPPPLGGRLSPQFSDIDDNSVLSPIGIGRREDDCTDGSSGSDSPRRSPIRGGWVNVQHERDGGQGRESMRRISRPPATSSPIQHGANL